MAYGDQLMEVLAKLSASESLTLARKVERARALGQETLPSDLVLAGLRPQLRELKPERTPTLCRVVCEGFEDFLTDQSEGKRPPGLISRSVIRPWWSAVTKLAAAEVKELTQELRALIQAGETDGIATLGVKARKSAVKWTEAVTAAVLKGKGADPEIQKQLNSPDLQSDLREMAIVLRLAEPLREAVRKIFWVATRSEEVKGRLFTDFSEGAVTEAKGLYRDFHEKFGLESAYLALALMNRMESPWHVLRLARAFAWKATDAMVRDTEFGIVGERLLAQLQGYADKVKELVSPRRGAQPEGVPFDEVATLIGNYIDLATGLTAEFGFRRDSPWGEAILHSRTTLADTLGEDHMEIIQDEILALMPVRRRQVGRQVVEDPDTSTAPSELDLARALGAARHLVTILQRGTRQGFANSARDALEALGPAIEKRSEVIGEVLRERPNDPILVAQLEGGIKVAEILFEDGRAEIMARRMRTARFGEMSSGLNSGG